MGNINDLVPSESKYLKKEDVGEGPGQVVTIMGFNRSNVGDENSPEIKGCIKFQEFAKPMIVNPTNRDLLILILGTEDTDAMKGKKVGLWVDPSVSMHGKLVGGVRFKAIADKTEDDTTPEFNDDIPW